MHKILLYKKFIIRLYMFRALYAHHQGAKIVLYSICSHHTCSWPSSGIIIPVVGRPVHRLREDWFNQFSLNLCTVRPPTGLMIPDAV